MEKINLPTDCDKTTGIYIYIYIHILHKIGKVAYKTSIQNEKQNFNAIVNCLNIWLCLYVGSLHVLLVLAQPSTFIITMTCTLIEVVILN